MRRGVLDFEELEEKGTAVEREEGCLKGRMADGESYGYGGKPPRILGGESMMIRIRRR